MPVKDPAVVNDAEAAYNEPTEAQKAEGAEAMRIAKINHPEVDWQADPKTGAPLVGGHADVSASTVEPQPLEDEDDPLSPHVLPAQQAEKQRKEEELQESTAEPTGKDKERVEADAKSAKAAEKAAKDADK